MKEYKYTPEEEIIQRLLGYVPLYDIVMVHNGIGLEIRKFFIRSIYGSICTFDVVDTYSMYRHEEMIYITVAYHEEGKDSDNIIMYADWFEANEKTTI